MNTSVQSCRCSLRGKGKKKKKKAEKRGGREKGGKKKKKKKDTEVILCIAVWARRI